jgi:hypothetical protein
MSTPRVGWRNSSDIIRSFYEPGQELALQRLAA